MFITLTNNGNIKIHLSIHKSLILSKKQNFGNPSTSKRINLLLYAKEYNFLKQKISFKIRNKYTLHSKGFAKFHSYFNRYSLVHCLFSSVKPRKNCEVMNKVKCSHTQKKKLKILLLYSKHGEWPYCNSLWLSLTHCNLKIYKPLVIVSF